MSHYEYSVDRIMGFLDKTEEDFPNEGYFDICIKWEIFATAFTHMVRLFDGYTVTYMGHTGEWVMFRFEDEAETLKEAEQTIELHKQAEDINQYLPEDYDDDKAEARRLFESVMEEFYKELHKGNN